MDVKDWYYFDLMDSFFDYMNDNMEYEHDNDFDDIYDDMCMWITGNDCGRRPGFVREKAREIAFDNSFLVYLDDLGIDLGKIIRDHGEEGVDVYAAYFIIENNYSKFKEEWDEHCTQYNLAEY